MKAFDPKDQEEVVDGQGTEEVVEEETTTATNENPGSGDLVD